MLIDFEVENFRSYREPKRFSMVASSSKELPENTIALHDQDLKLLRSAAVYGANASGKSNLMAAMHFLGDMLDAPTSRPISHSVIFSPFALDRDSSGKAVKFTVRFLAEGTPYKYSAAFRPEGIEEEKLSAYPLGREQVWFHRERDKTDFNRTHLKGQKQSLLEVTPGDKLFLTIAAAFEHPQLSIPAHWLINNLRNRLDYYFPSTGWYRRALPQEEASARLYHEDAAFKIWASGFLKHADLVQDVVVELVAEIIRRPIPVRSQSGEIIRTQQEFKESHYEPYFLHTGDGMTARFGLAEESLGTRRLFSMLASFYQVLKTGQLAVIDELSASIHPSMVREIVRLFHDPHLNPNGAQLVFVTHDTALLSNKLFRRDQVWFTEKNAVGATDLYSLNDIKGVREGESFEKGYLRGRYGAIPFFGQFDFPEIKEKEQEADQGGV